MKKLFVCLSALVVLCVAAAQAEEFPYVGKISGSNVNVRAKADLYREVVCQLTKGDEVKVVNFGDASMGHNYSAEARKSYLARSAGIKGKDDKFSANYWARKVLWAGPKGSKKAPPGGSRFK